MNNIVLSFLNAVALVVLVSFQFQGSGKETEQVQAQSSHVMHQSAQVAVMHQQRGIQAMLAKDSNEATPTSVDRSERWVF
ncbi:hypothetical protein QN386_03760 [Pseudomonas sp. CCI3.2]|uniref:hypothetical protein n=1 Tax=unclassified Pseudomonas TaxID=196821 RepID=UPI002AC8AA3C|nr:MULTISPECIES: hypothetical protein [unclassified Pseudomonas]MEB0080202.1 hypothetical protein [Pseudomonas sp. MH10out]MEB0094240.1 hypothetical protein [Pseudomonas sp. CCI4.2]MEB0100441.1 hypothetical protein [Pseudomonas sp. CCI3.2]MEB0132777.1 hypothetical protein [Pseudomonas sp. CCI2.4]MEB0160631.1 hypothetical protein [Pseudomonas sp. AH2 (2023)]